MKRLRETIFTLCAILIVISGVVTVKAQVRAERPDSFDHVVEEEMLNNITYTTEEGWELTLRLEGWGTDENGEVVIKYDIIKGTNESGADLIIPEQINGHEVDSICTGAFKDCKIGTLRIPQAIKVETKGFDGCEIKAVYRSDMGACRDSPTVSCAIGIGTEMYDSGITIYTLTYRTRPAFYSCYIENFYYNHNPNDVGADILRHTMIVR